MNPIPLIGEYVGVVVPKDAKQIIVVGKQLRYKLNTLKFWWDNIPLPSRYTLICVYPGCSEAVCDEVVRGDLNYFANGDDGLVLYTNTQLLESLLKHAGLENKTVVILKIK